MPNDIDLKQSIASAIERFSSQSLGAAVLALFQALGYRSDKRLALSSNSPVQFLIEFNRAGRLNEAKALIPDWQSVDFLFQLTDEEIQAALTPQGYLFANHQVDHTIINSYLFFAIHLSGERYTRTQLATITREVNKLFPMPVMILFRHGPTLTLSIIARRLHKRDPGKDVLEKVTLIKDISITSPHRAHIEILFDLSIEQLCQHQPFTNFVELQRAWEKTLDIAELNKKFYREVADWYFWAVKNVEFPPGGGTDVETRNATSVIRLITRLIFVWFMKEKGLIPEDLFDARRLRGILNYIDAKNSTYYKAILQNLFFATLNTEMGEGRRFRGKNRSGGLDAHYGITTVYRYEDCFNDPQTAIRIFGGIPFLNGGLFECLDKREEKILIDGFSDDPRNQPVVPDDLFFGKEHFENLSDVYGDPHRSHEKVRGLIHIFNSYKFTIEENTPVEEEIALDPELLGKVFENLLAAYNPETGTTARKQTGSFYTPREIVNYMVDEALIAYLETALIPTPLPEGKGQTKQERLRLLLAYNNEPHQFSEDEEQRLITAIDAVKVLDPACGSGAFPMGVLHKLVFILNKLDPGNVHWKERQIAKAAEFPDVTVRERAFEDIEQAFNENELDYGRKLYLIENCIYGVDIQPIAVQIAKLRFFISLVVDQKVDRSKPNFGIRPLPNLETKFVAANTLIKIEHPRQMMLHNPKIDDKEKELADVRDALFIARTPETKRKYREKDKQLRTEIANLLKTDGWESAAATQLASWDPYDQNSFAGYFDPEWMFGIAEGFDVVIGNPPYVSVKSITQSEKRKLSNLYYSGQGRFNLFTLMLEKGFQILKPGGSLIFIIPEGLYTNVEYRHIRKLLLENTEITQIVLFTNRVFEAAVDTSIIKFHKKTNTNNQILVIKDLTSQITFISQNDVLNRQNYIIPVNSNDSNKSIFEKMERISRIHISDVLEIQQGIIYSGRPKNEVFSNEKINEQYKKCLDGRDINKWYINWKEKLENRYIAYNNKLHRPREERLFLAKEKIVLPRRSTEILCAYDDERYYALNTAYVCLLIPAKHFLSLKYILACLNSRLYNYYYKNTYLGWQITIPALNSLPIIIIDEKKQEIFAEKVDQILLAKRTNPLVDTSTLEAEIDWLMYDLYGLTEEEIAIIEEKA